MPSFELDVVSSSSLWGDAALWQNLFEKAATETFKKTELDNQALQVSLLLADDAEIALYNEQWRGKAMPTNVLSFPSAPQARAAGFLGDIVMSYETLQREAQEQQKSLQNHALHLFVHGLLHLLGHDHDISAEAEAMEAQERKILLELGVPDPYEERAEESIKRS
ncbi:MAG: rRNA maturation RNase YbeY [Pseudomonadota bacterium]